MLSSRVLRLGKPSVWLGTGSSVAVAAGSAALLAVLLRQFERPTTVLLSSGSQISKYTIKPSCWLGREGGKSISQVPSRGERAPQHRRRPVRKAGKPAQRALAHFPPNRFCSKALSHEKGEHSKCLLAEPRSSTSPGSTLPCCSLRVPLPSLLPASVENCLFLSSLPSAFSFLERTNTQCR